MIEICERDGWIAECPSCKHNFKATVLKPWGGSWIVFYSNVTDIFYLDDYNGSQNIIDYLGNNLFDDYSNQNLNLKMDEFSVNFGPKCPKCSQLLGEIQNINPDSVMWIDGQILLDGKIKKTTRARVNVNQ